MIIRINEVKNKVGPENPIAECEGLWVIGATLSKILPQSPITGIKVAMK